MMIAVQIVAGFFLLIVGAEVLVRGAVRLASLLGMTPLVIGLTVVAFGTSSPELAVSIQSVYADSGELAVGNAVGSNTLNVLLILGLSSLVLPLAVKRQVVRLDVPVMIAATIALWLIVQDGRIDRVEGIGMVTALVLYISLLIAIARKETRKQREESNYELQEEVSAGSVVKQLVMVVIGLVVLGVACRLFVDGSVELARVLGVSELLIGLTVVSIGTSLPELVTTVVASARGQRELAVGNIVGSNLFNILCVLGVTACVCPDFIPVPQPAIDFDIPVTLAAAVICLPIFYSGMEVSRWEGALMLGLYSVYLAWLIMSAMEVSGLDVFARVIWFGVIPLTLLLLIGSTISSWKQRTSQT